MNKKKGLVLDLVVVAIGVSLVSLLILSQMALNVKAQIENYFETSVFLQGEKVANTISILESVDYNTTVKIVFSDVTKVKPNLPYEVCLANPQGTACVPLVIIENNKNTISSDEVQCGILVVSKTVIDNKHSINLRCD